MEVGRLESVAVNEPHNSVLLERTLNNGFCLMEYDCKASSPSTYSKGVRNLDFMQIFIFIKKEMT